MPPRTDRPLRFQTDVRLDLSAELDSLEKESGLGLVGLLLARADKTFDSLRRFGALSLLEFVHPGGDRIHHSAGRLPGSLWFILLPFHALSAFDDFYLFLRHKS